MLSVPAMTVAPGATRPTATPAVPAETARAFEAMLLRPMIDAMVPRGGALGEEAGSDAWRDMLVGALADEVARSGAIGLDALLPSPVAENAR